MAKNEIDKLFSMFSRGEIPNVLQLMAAISNIETLWPESDYANYTTQQSADCKKSCPSAPTHRPERCARCA